MSKVKPVKEGFAVDLELARYRLPRAAFKRFPIQIELQAVAEAGASLSAKDRAQNIRTIGPSPKGVIIFSNDGHFSLFQSRAGIPKIAANDRAKATPEEAQSIVAARLRITVHTRLTKILG